LAIAGHHGWREGVLGQPVVGQLDMADEVHVFSVRTDDVEPDWWPGRRTEARVSIGRNPFNRRWRC
jgi:hypothetical protein